MGVVDKVGGGSGAFAGALLWYGSGVPGSARASSKQITGLDRGSSSSWPMSEQNDKNFEALKTRSFWPKHIAVLSPVANGIQMTKSLEDLDKEWWRLTSTMAYIDYYSERHLHSSFLPLPQQLPPVVSSQSLWIHPMSAAGHDTGIGGHSGSPGALGLATWIKVLRTCTASGGYDSWRATREKKADKEEV